MSYCRWSSDNWKSDVYTYHCVDGTWTTHVAGRRKIGHIPDDKWNDFISKKIDAKEFARLHKIHMDAVGACEMVDIDLPHAGETFRDPDPSTCAATLERLRSIGYHVPQYAIDDLKQEASEIADKS